MTVRSFIHLAALAALLLASVMHGQRTNRSPSDSPDLASGSAATSLAVVNARIWTGDARRPWADGLAAEGERAGECAEMNAARHLEDGIKPLQRRATAKKSGQANTTAPPKRRQ